MTISGYIGLRNKIANSCLSLAMRISRLSVITASVCGERSESGRTHMILVMAFLKKKEL
jgi:hypothetical protein